MILSIVEHLCTSLRVTCCQALYPSHLEFLNKLPVQIFRSYHHSSQQKFCQDQSCNFKAPHWVSAEANNEQFDYDDVFKVRHHGTITVGVPALISFVF